MSGDTEHYCNTFHCPCGAGTVTEDVTEFAHMWAASRSAAWRIDCPACSQELVVVGQHAYPREAHAAVLASTVAAKAAMDVVHAEVAAAAKADLHNHLTDTFPSMAAEHRALLAAFPYYASMSYDRYLKERRKEGFRDIVYRALRHQLMRSWSSPAEIHRKATADAAVHALSARNRVGINLRELTPTASQVI